MKKIFFLVTITLILLGCKNDKNKDDLNKESIQDSTTVENGTKGYKVGDIATDFLLKSTDGKSVSLKDYKDAKGFIIIFTCNHCPYAKAYEDRIINLHNRFLPEGYPVVAINPNDPEIQPEDSFEKMVERAKQKNFPFAYVWDDKQEVFPVYGATKTPHVFILRKENKNNVVKYIGTIDDNYENPKDVSVRFVEDAIYDLLANREVRTTNTVAIGCSIKSK